MSYTVKTLAKLSGVSHRTLRFYDEIGLLKPARYGDNNYRYYEEEQLLLLQQILFFRELGFPLNDIQTFMSNPSFNKVETLINHKRSLQQSLNKTALLIKTIDKTVSHLTGEEKLSAINLYEGFQTKIEKAVEEYTSDMKQDYINSGMSKEDITLWDQAMEQGKILPPEEFHQIMARINIILKEFVTLIENNLSTDSPEARALVAKHYDWTCRMSGAISKHGYYIMFKQSVGSPPVEDYYNKYHPKLMEYLNAAIKLFSKQK